MTSNNKDKTRLVKNRSNTKKSRKNLKVIGFPAHSVAKYFFLVLLLLFLYITFLVLKPYLSYLLIGLVLAYAAHPLHKFFLKLFKNKNIAATLTTLVILILVFVPLYFLIAKLLAESISIYSSILNLQPSQGSNQNSTTSSATILESLLSSIGLQSEVSAMVKNIIAASSTVLIKAATSLLADIPRFLVGIVLLLFVTFYALRDGNVLYNWMRTYFPLEKHRRERFLEEIKITARAVVYSQFLSALAQAITAGIGYALFGVNQVVFWSFLTFITAFIPFIGPPLIWVPLAVLKLFSGSVASGVLLLTWGLVLVSNVDNVVRMKFLHHETKVHSVLMLIGFIGGVHLWGFAGILLGPLVLSITIKLLDFYTEEFEGL
ncbi:AI-2E family transporter [Candidatus Woesearchaeota archaeon]|nr:AI-2E family transporter [Candidatus Woesearchaeota archaeon]